MNKKVLGFAVVLMVVAILATPVVAKPTQGQKAAITISWTPAGASGEKVFTGKVEHRHYEGNWNPIVIEIDGGPTYTGAAFDTVREVLRVPQEDGMTIVLREYIEMWFPDEGGGFEGNYIVMRHGVGGDSGRARAHGLLQGYGAFEGQTINAGHNWVPFPSPPVWSGYLLKP